MDKQGVCYIFGAAPIEDYSDIKITKSTDDLVVCADGGFRHIKPLGLETDIVIGDFDSGDKPEDNFVIEYPTKKDETDMLLAAKAGLARGYRRFKLYGGMGGRFDHTVANVQLLICLAEHGASGVLYDRTNEVRVLCDEGTLTLREKPGYKISLLSLTDRCTGVTTSGLEYPLDNDVLTNDFPIGVSNTFIKSDASVTIESGKLLVILSKD